MSTGSVVPDAHQVLVNGVRIAYQDVGEGEPLVLVHGSWGSQHNWDPVVPGLSERVTHVRVHRFRHGLPEAMPRAVRLRAAFAGRPAAAVEYAGDWVSLRPCSEGAVASAASAAERVLAHLSGMHPSGVHPSHPLHQE